MSAVVRMPYRDLDAATASRVSDRLDAGDRRRLVALGADRAGIERFLAGRWALYTAAARVGERDIRLAAACVDCGLSHGQPRALGTGRPLHLALAHADGAAFAIASRAPVGIDAELDRTPDGRTDAVDELVPGPGRPLRRWTAVEAVLKADGRGLRVAPDAVRLGRVTAVLDGRRYRLRTTRIAGCVVTVATLQRESDGSRV